MNTIKTIRMVMLSALLMPSLIVASGAPVSISKLVRQVAAQAAALKEEITVTEATMGQLGRNVKNIHELNVREKSPFERPFKPKSMSAGIGTGLLASVYGVAFFGSIGAGIGYCINSLSRYTNAPISSATKTGFYAGGIFGVLAGFTGAYKLYKAHNKISKSGKTFMQAIESNDIKFIDQWIEKDELIVIKTDDNGRSALMHAAMLKKPDVIEAILKVVRPNFFLADSDGKSTYRHFVDNGYKDLFDKIVCKGNKRDIEYFRDKNAENEHNRRIGVNPFTPSITLN